MFPRPSLTPNSGWLDNDWDPPIHTLLPHQRSWTLVCPDTPFPGSIHTGNRSRCPSGVTGTTPPRGRPSLGDVLCLPLVSLQSRRLCTFMTIPHQNHNRSNEGCWTVLSYPNYQTIIMSVPGSLRVWVRTVEGSVGYRTWLKPVSRTMAANHPTLTVH